MDIQLNQAVTIKLLIANKRFIMLHIEREARFCWKNIAYRNDYLGRRYYYRRTEKVTKLAARDQGSRMLSR